MDVFIIVAKKYVTPSIGKVRMTLVAEEITVAKEHKISDILSEYGIEYGDREGGYYSPWIEEGSVRYQWSVFVGKTEVQE